MQANKITGTAVSIRRYASDIAELSYSLRCFPRGYNRVQTAVPTRKCGLPLCCGDVAIVCPDPQDKRWREQSFARQADFSISLRNSQDNSDAPDGVWISRIRVLEHGVCREFAPVFAKHSKSFSLIDPLAIGVDRIQRNFGPCKRIGRKGEHERAGN
jgi:hypothetical protein